MLKLDSLDGFILVLMFFLLPVDMVNGMLLKNNVIMPISVSQLFKFFLLSLILFRFLITIKLLFITLTATFLLLFPTFYQLIVNFEESSLFLDILKIVRYITPIICFLFFLDVIKRSQGQYLKLFQLVKTSYIILIINVFIKYIGLGYPAYKSGGFGTKGFFYAGNELSALLLILCSILAFSIWKKGGKFNYYSFMIVNLLAALTIGSKTAVIGIILIFFIIPYLQKKVSAKKVLLTLSATVILLPLLSYASWRFIQNSDIFVRIEYFYERLDFWTFILSSRNVFLENAFDNYLHKYSVIEKIIGVGQTRYEMLNHYKLVEMDIIDIFFAYGFLGIFLFGLIISYILLNAIRLSKLTPHLYASFVLMMMIILLVVSSLAGHVFGSGMSAVFLGLLFSLMYVRIPENKVFPILAKD